MNIKGKEKKVQIVEMSPIDNFSLTLTIDDLIEFSVEIGL